MLLALAKPIKTKHCACMYRYDAERKVIIKSNNYIEIYCMYKCISGGWLTLGIHRPKEVEFSATHDDRQTGGPPALREAWGVRPYSV